MVGYYDYGLVTLPYLISIPDSYAERDLYEQVRDSCDPPSGLPG